MKKYILLFCCVAATSLSLLADVKGTVTDEDGQPIVGANLIWKNTGVGATTDLDGNFVLSVSPLTDTLIVSYVSYENDTLIAKDGDILTVQMGGTVALSELDVAARKVALSKSRTAVFDVQTISGEELCKAACCNLSESFETNPSRCGNRGQTNQTIGTLWTICANHDREYS